MLSLGSMDENLHFLILEVVRQLERTRRYLASPSDKTLDIILRGDDYIDHLRNIIQRKCFAHVREMEGDDRFELELLKSIDLITSNLERIADFCESIVGQFHHLTDAAAIEELDLEANFATIVDGLNLVESAISNRDVQKGLAICQVETRLDEVHARTFRNVLARLDRGEDAQTHVTILFMSHYLERMGDSMLNIGEAILSAALGERIKIDEFHALRTTMEEAGAFPDGDATDFVSLEALGETRSGCRIDRVADPSGRMVVFKEGRTDKLIDEKRCVDLWNEKLPGYAPEIYSFQESGDSGAILFEYLPGRTFEQLLLLSDVRELEEAIVHVGNALHDVWSRTREDRPVRPDFIAQLTRRMDSVYELHPSFSLGASNVGGVQVAPFDEVLREVARVDEVLEAPFSVLGHGDLNVDNIIFDPNKRTVRFIDLHRSGRMDYVQDVSVFLVSHCRLQVFDPAVRARIQDVTHRIHDFAREFAARAGDTTFPARLAAGLARSFATSARFVLDEEFAKSLFFRARYLLEQLAALADEDVPHYEPPEDILVD